MKDISRLAVGLLFLGLAIFFSLQYPSSPSSVEPADENDSQFVKNQDALKTEWQQKPATATVESDAPLLNPNPNELGSQHAKAEPAIFSSSSVSDNDHSQQMFEIEQPPRISDRYHPLLPFRVSDDNSRSGQDLVPIQPKQTFAGYQSNQFRLHTIRDGDTLQSIAQEYFGSPQRYLEIYSLNKSLLADPGHLPLGQQLKIPEQ